MAPIAPSEQETGVKAVVNERFQGVGPQWDTPLFSPTSPPPCLFLFHVTVFTHSATWWGTVWGRREVSGLVEQVVAPPCTDFAIA